MRRRDDTRRTAISRHRTTDAGILLPQPRVVPTTSNTITGNNRERSMRMATWLRSIAAALLIPAVPWLAVAAEPETPLPDATHRYGPVVDAKPSDAAQALAARLDADAVVLELTAPGADRPLARVEAAALPGGGARILDWRSLTPAPLLRRDIRAGEDLKLVEALDTHLPVGSTVLAFPGVSRRLTALVAADFPLATVPEPLVMPVPLTRRGAEAAAVEAAQWGGPAQAGGDGGTLDAFLNALLAEDVNGAARLRVLAGTGEAYILMHLEDVFQLGHLRAGRMELNRRNFAAAGFSHDLAREARRWGQSHDYAAWAVDRGPDGNLRGHYLADPAETATLAAQLLPFNTSRIDAVPGMRLVWQWQGYWLYRIAPIPDRDRTN